MRKRTLNPCSRIQACPSARALTKGPSVSWLPSRAICFCYLPLHSQSPPAQHPGPHTCNNRTLCPAWIQADWLPLKPSTLDKDFHRFPLSFFITKHFLLYNTSDMWLASPFALIRSATACRWKTTWLQPLAHSSKTNTYFKWMFSKRCWINISVKWGSLLTYKVTPSHAFRVFHSCHFIAFWQPWWPM